MKSPLKDYPRATEATAADRTRVWQMFAQLLADEGVFDHGLKFRSMVFPDTFIDHDSPAAMYAAAQMNAPDIEAKVLEVMGVAQIGAQRA